MILAQAAPILDYAQMFVTLGGVETLCMHFESNVYTLKI